MRPLVALTNIVLGLAYLGIGWIVITDLRREWRSNGFSHFGAAFVALALTCGPHHLEHGLHVAFEGRAGGPLDLIAVLIGLPVGIVWLLLRVEAFRGGRGDRFIQGTPSWLAVVPTLSGLYFGAIVMAALTTRGPVRITSNVVPNVLLVGIYLTIGYFLLRTQLRNRGPLGGWSVSGLTLTGIFPTCALMHGAWILYNATGAYTYDIHGFTIDWISVPAGLYFLWVVRGLYRESLRDWNRPPEVARAPETVAA